MRLSPLFLIEQEHSHASSKTGAKVMKEALDRTYLGLKYSMDRLSLYAHAQSGQPTEWLYFKSIVCLRQLAGSTVGNCQLRTQAAT